MIINTRVVAGLGVCLIAISVRSANADTTLANWTFETSVPNTAGPYAAEAGLFAATSLVSGSHASASAVYSNPVGNGSLESYSSNFWAVGDFYQFTTSTLGFSGISIAWNQTRSSTGPGTFDLLWSVDGTNFTLLLNDYIVPAASWSSTTPDASSVFAPVAGPAALDNQTTVWFRLVCDLAPGATGGTNRIDNIVIAAAVPAPGALALLGAAALLRSRRRR